MPYLDSEDRRTIQWDEEEINIFLNGDIEFAKQLSEDVFHWLDAKTKEHIL